MQRPAGAHLIVLLWHGRRLLPLLGCSKQLGWGDATCCMHVGALRDNGPLVLLLVLLRQACTHTGAGA